MSDRIEQLVQYVWRMREPDVVRPDEEDQIRTIAALIADDAVDAAVKRIRERLNESDVFRRSPAVLAMILDDEIA